MADKRIDDFATLEEAQDDDLLLVSSEDETYNIRIKALKNVITGNMDNLSTKEKGSVVLAINEIFNSLEDHTNSTPLPIARGQSEDGAAYVAAGENLPDVKPGSNGTHAGKGKQIIFIPDRSANKIENPTLQINGGDAIPIRMRAPKNHGTFETNPDATLPVPVGALMVGVPYTMTFCGLYWLIDSQITQYACADDAEQAELLRNFAAKLMLLYEGDTIGMPIINSVDGVGTAKARIKRSAEEDASPDVSGNVILPTEARVKEMTEICVVNMVKNADGTYTADKTFSELKAAHDAGRTVICSLLDIAQQWDAPYRLPVVGTSNVHIGFAGVIEPAQNYKIFAQAYINKSGMGYTATELRNLPESTTDDNGKVLTVASGHPVWKTNDPYVDVTAGYNAWVPESGAVKTVENYTKTLQDGRYYVYFTDWDKHYYVDILTVGATQWRTIRSYLDESFCVTVYRDSGIAMKIDQELATVEINGTGVITTSHIPLPSKDDKGKVLMATGAGAAAWTAVTNAEEVAV